MKKKILKNNKIDVFGFAIINQKGGIGNIG